MRDIATAMDGDWHDNVGNLEPLDAIGINFQPRR